MSLTDSRRVWVMLRDAGEQGCHSHELRRRGISGNPSQRAKDIVSHGVAVFTARENVGKRPGARYWLAEHAPDWAVPVRANGAEGGGGEPGEVLPHRGPAADAQDATALSIEPSSEQVGLKQPVAIVRDGDGFSEVPVRPCRRCKDGQLASGEICPACAGTAQIASARVNSYVDEREAA